MGLVLAEPPTAGFRQKGEILEESASHRCHTSEGPTMSPARAVTARSLRKDGKSRVTQTTTSQGQQ